MDEIIKSHPVLWLLGALITGFVSGFGAFKAILAVGAHEIVRKGSYILRTDIVGNLVRSGSLKELDHLVELGEKLTEVEAHTYMLRVLTFVHTLDLDRAGLGGKRSFAEERIDYIISDIPRTGRPDLPLLTKVQQIVGLLKGIRGALNARVND